MLIGTSNQKTQHQGRVDLLECWVLCFDWFFSEPLLIFNKLGEAEGGDSSIAREKHPPVAYPNHTIAGNKQHIDSCQFLFLLTSSLETYDLA
ncbi:hypothetical protein J2S74_000974 [Evansella vedderi]|uniref:Uncharacterized protein n=1 Tax=Evansella vedderi TaxID=38282 RepID=A0ABT9ZS61_9BACI|nr:hypothetical protein [Evansella vedderi]